ncbi:hypothetical protein [Xenorhabdus bovienii]|uniref:Uncharacterized protein n=1 Tax=Xenorhabdus bovienii str. kraussei Becker Underwood TaxID=1398204 RepID=A0A077PMR3_XENBV|nr:hypothetical protein [Xenorhabdus bovienii]CDH22363.1 conserved hypothetical protein [Xenorhabdus bovienii str. kraussei Becker Underwood]
MLKKLELDTLKAELTSIEHLISERGSGDPIGLMQFISRKIELLDKINEIQNIHRTKAEVGLFFGGSPVFGSKGIDANFATLILDKFQALVSKRFAFLENGILSARGPVPNSNNTKLMITNVARGSFGFVLEETPQPYESMIESDLKYVVEDVNNIINNISSDEDDLFDNAFEELDERILIEIRGFYNTLYSSGATLRIVDSNNEYLLTNERIRRAKDRVELVKISEEREMTIEGNLYLLPSDKKFEIQLINSLESIKGRVNKGFFDKHPEEVSSLVGKSWVMHLVARDILENEVVVKTKYILTDLS